MGLPWKSSPKAVSAIGAALLIAALAIYWFGFHAAAVATVPVREGAVPELVRGAGTCRREFRSRSAPVSPRR